jgi:hypothetical protein
MQPHIFYVEINLLRKYRKANEKTINHESSTKIKPMKSLRYQINFFELG